MRLFEPIVNLRNRLLASQKFRSRSQKLPIFQQVANHSAARLFALVSGFVHSQVLFAVVQAQLPKALEEGPRSVAELAATTALPAARLQTLLRAAAALGLCEEVAGQRFALGQLGAVLIANPGVTAMVQHHAALYNDLADPLALIGDANFSGQLQRYWAYADSNAPEDLDAAHVADYTALMGASQEAVAEQILDAIDLADVRVLLDLGGGNGSFAIAAATRWPHLRVTVADLPPVAAAAREHIDAAGLAERVTAVGIDFTAADLPTGHDAVSIVRILHDHDDPVAARLLRDAASSLPPNGRVIVAEPLADSDTTGRLLEAYFSLYLLAMGQGRLRRFDEIEKLLQAAGCSDIQRFKTRMPLITSVLSGRRTSKA